MDMYIRSNGGLWFFDVVQCLERRREEEEVEKKLISHDIAKPKSNAKIQNPPTLYNRDHLNIDTAPPRLHTYNTTQWS